MNKKFENRAYNFEIRSEKLDGGVSRIKGMPIVYNSEADIGGWFREIIEPGALDGANLKDVPLLVNHNREMIPVARSRNNNANSTMRLVITDAGLEMTAELDTERNATAKELDSAIERGDVDGMSFWFAVSGERWENLESDYPTRYITAFEAIREISAVTWPAYESTSIYSARCKEALESARSALESARQAAAEPPEGGELELLKLKTKILGGF